MSREDWFRNTEWGPRTEEHFFAKLARAKNKAQYLRIQAYTLRNSHPKIALKLLEQYFALGGHFDRVQAYVDRAEAYLSLGEEERAIEAYERALARERQFPNARTEAYIDFAFLIATRCHREKYEQALDLLRKKEPSLFPAQLFKREASIALISADLGDEDTARQHAMRALDAAAARISGLRYHPNLGLVGSRYESTRSLLRRMVSG